MFFSSLLAIHGYSFTTSARRAFSIISSNTLKIAIINSIGDFILLVGKLCVIFVTVIIGIEMIKEKLDKLNYSWSPLLIAALISYFISHCFLAAYEVSS